MLTRKNTIIWKVCFVCLPFLFLLHACKKDQPVIQIASPIDLVIPEGFPKPDIPADNQLTLEGIELGKRLFFDPVLSSDSTVSCASCHQQNKAFTDGLAVSVGVGGKTGFRNAPSLSNLAWHPYFFREGGSPTLEHQALIPIFDENEMDNTVAVVNERLRQIPEYVELARIAYDSEINANVIGKALGAYERILISGNAYFDQYQRGDVSVLNEAQIRGMELFFDELQCASCHTGFNFTNYAFENNGLYETYQDEGLARLTSQTSDIGKFKTPSLRNVELTAPYMHDGSLANLEEVVEHYDIGGSNHPNKNTMIEALNLSEQQKNDLISFLESLTDETFLNNPEYQ